MEIETTIKIILGLIALGMIAILTFMIKVLL